MSTKQRLVLITFGVILLSACGWNDLSESSEENGSEIELEESMKNQNPYANMDKWDLKRIGAVAYEDCQEHPANIAQWSLINGFKWTSGFEHRDQQEIYVYLDKSETGFNLKMQFYLPQQDNFPTVYDSRFGDRDEADHLGVDIIIRNDKNNKKIKLSDDASISSSTWRASSLFFGISLSDLHSIPAGVTTFSVDIKTYYQSFFGVKSKEKAINSSITFQFDMPKLYYTDLYFKKLAFNKEQVKEFLGSDNDFSDPKPETAIKIQYQGETVLFKNTKNSYTLYSSAKERMYHTSKNDQVKITILDMDYGFNGSDPINDTTVFLKDLESNSYIDLPMKYADELLLYARFGGKANFKD